MVKPALFGAAGLFQYIYVMRNHFFLANAAKSHLTSGACCLQVLDTNPSFGHFLSPRRRLVICSFHFVPSQPKVPEGSRRLQEVSGTFHTIDARTQFSSPDLAQSVFFFSGVRTNVQMSVSPWRQHGGSPPRVEVRVRLVPEELPLPPVQDWP